MTASYGAQNLEECRHRLQYLEYLYSVDGRDLRTHECHSTYTGLVEKYGFDYRETA